MKDKVVMDKKIEHLKRKLDISESSITLLEHDLKALSSLLIPFIDKLSQACKGLDITLDNQLANLRSLLKQSPSISEIENQIKSITVILQQHSTKNEINVRLIHDQFTAAGLSLQKMNGLPDKLRRELRDLLKNGDKRKDALIEYVPILSQLLVIYEGAFKITPAVPVGGLLASLSQPLQKVTPTVNNIQVDKLFIDKFSNILSDLVLSDIHTKHISSIKSKLTTDMSNDKFFSSFFEVFEVILEDLKQERNTAKVFLSTLSKTLATVQSSVKSTITKQKDSQDKHGIINQELQKQLGNMSLGLHKATSLSDLKIDINTKLELIVNTIQKKSLLEIEQQDSLKCQLSDMANKVDILEKQSKSFEKRIQEQQQMSMLDALTKLANRASFDDYFAKQMVRYHHKNFDLAIAVLDLDNFKRINDTYGHTAGDKTLQVIANTLQKNTGDEAFVARYGGEEFVIIYCELNKEKVVKKLENLRQQIARLPFKFKNNKVSITISIGVSHILPDDNIHVAFDRADTALYEAKAQGKNQVIYL